MNNKLKNKFIVIDGDAKNWEEAIRLCGAALTAGGCVDHEFVEGCIAREREYPTGLPNEIPVAIPHYQCDSIHKNSVCLLRLKEPVVFYRMDSDDEYVSTRYVFNLAIKGADDHLDYLQKLMALVMDTKKLETCFGLPNREAEGLLADYLS